MNIGSKDQGLNGLTMEINTTYFHRKVSCREQKNHIVVLHNEQAKGIR